MRSISSRGSIDFSSYLICLSKRTFKKKKGHRSILILADFFPRKVLFPDGTDGRTDGRDGTGRTDGNQKCPLFFFILRYIQHYTYIYKKCPDKFLVGLKFWSSWGVTPTIFKITLEETVFSKMVPNFTFPAFWIDFVFFFFFRNKIEGDCNFFVNVFSINFKGFLL